VPLAPQVQQALDRWMAALEARHLRDLTFQEVSRALRALSSCYVERRGRLASGGALEGRGKRAAFALFYAPLHFLTTAHIVSATGMDAAGATLLDLGCGTGAAGAAWALAAGGADVRGVDRSAWAVREAEWTWRTLGIRGRAVRADVGKVRWPRGRVSALAAYTVNELPPAARRELRGRLLQAAGAGHDVLVIEPLAGAVAPWWEEWVEAFAAAGGRQGTWRARVELPALVSRLDRAAGLQHRELTARWLLATGRPASVTDGAPP
jgi:predicted RNA methylase